MRANIRPKVPKIDALQWRCKRYAYNFKQNHDFRQLYIREVLAKQKQLNRWCKQLLWFYVRNQCFRMRNIFMFCVLSTNRNDCLNDASFNFNIIEFSCKKIIAFYFCNLIHFTFEAIPINWCKRYNYTKLYSVKCKLVHSIFFFVANRFNYKMFSFTFLNYEMM